MSGIDVNTSTIALPTKLSNKIIAKLQEDSAVMRLSSETDLPGTGATIPVITGDPEASWVTETEEKPVSRPTLGAKTMKAYTLAVIVPFSNQFRRNAEALYNEIVARLPRALAKKFDYTVFHGAAPGSHFDTFANITAQSIAGNNNSIYKTLVAADGDVSAHDGIMDGVVISPQFKSMLLGEVDANGRPLFIDSVADNAVPMILGGRTYISKAAYKQDTNNVLGYVGDWTQALYGVAQTLNLSISDQATINDGGTQINLWQRNMFAVRAEIECGFVADTDCFNAITE